MANTCKHKKAEITISSSMETDISPDGIISEGEPIRTAVQVNCRECGYYGHYRHKPPKWLTEEIKQRQGLSDRHWTE
jgi:hypothetical protein